MEWEALAKVVACGWRKSSLAAGGIPRFDPTKFVASALWIAFCIAAHVQSAGSTPHHRSLVEKPAPAFTVAAFNGKPVSLSDYKCDVLILNFWATWCGNCKVEMPWLAQLREKYASRGVEVLGIVTDNAPVAKITALAEKYGVHYPILACNHATAQAYGGLPDLPESFFIDRSGKIVAVMDGADSKEQIEANIQKALRR